MTDFERYVPKTWLSDCLLFDILGCAAFDSRKGTFDATKLKKCYFEQMRRFHPDKIGRFSQAYNYSKEEATTVAAYIEQAYRLLTTEDSLRDYIEQGREAWTGKEWVRWNEEGVGEIFSGYSGNIFNWDEAEEVLNIIERLNTPLPTHNDIYEEQDTPIDPCGRESPQEQRNNTMQSPDESGMDYDSQDEHHSETDSTSQHRTEQDSFEEACHKKEEKKRRRSSKRPSISSFADSVISKVLDHRRRAKSELKFQVIFEGLEEAGAIGITSIEMQEHHARHLLAYIAKLKETNDRKYKAYSEWTLHC